MLTALPPRHEMLAAFLASDAAFDGLFLSGVRTTGIVCRPSCAARKPREENVEFFRSLTEALAAGYRPCLRCRPERPAGEVPDWVQSLLDEVARDPARRWREQDLRDRGLNPDRVRRWFLAQHGASFHAWSRARRLGLALDGLRTGAPPLHAALDSGFDSLSGFSDALRKLVGAAPGGARATPAVRLARVPSPLGPLLAGATDEGVCLLECTDRRALERQLRTLHRLTRAALLPGECAPLTTLRAELEQYFAGVRRTFTTPLVLPGTEFQRQVWERLRAIPCGETRDYATIARQIGRPSAVRAVARANGDNRVAILVPCHRVIGSDGRLTGYGGGLWRKQWLLDHERAARPADAAAGPRGPAQAVPAQRA